jgi:urease accessory protein
MGSHSQLMLALATFADARLPSGCPVPASASAPPLPWNLTSADVPDLLIRRLETGTTLDAACAVLTRRVCAGERAAVGPLSRAAWLRAVWDHWTELADADEAVRGELSGIGYRRIVEQLWGWADAVRIACQAEWLVRRSPHSAVPASRRLPRPLVLGVAAACCGLDSAETVQLVAHDDLNSLTRAAERATDAGELARERWLRACRDTIAAVTWRVADIHDLEQIPRRGGRWARV